MAKGTVTVRLPEELLDAIKEEAVNNYSTVSQILIDAIMLGRKSESRLDHEGEEAPELVVSPKPQATETAEPSAPPTQAREVQLLAALEDLAGRVYSLECFLTGSNFALGQLLMTATRSAAAGQFYSRLATDFLNDISVYLVTNEVLEPEERKRRSYEIKQRCREFQQKTLNETYEQFQVSQENYIPADTFFQKNWDAEVSKTEDSAGSESSADSKAA